MQLQLKEHEILKCRSEEIAHLSSKRIRMSFKHVAVSYEKLSER